MSEIWFLANLRRLQVERQTLEALELSSEWLGGTHWTLYQGKLCIEAVILAHGHSYEIRLIYPDFYPEVPPSVYPKDKQEVWSSHQYTTGALCLEWRSDTWQPNITGAQVLESAYNLLNLENPYGKNHLIAPSQHEQTHGQELRTKYGRFYVSSDFAAHFTNLPLQAQGKLEFLTQFQSDSFVALIYRIQIEELAEWTDSGIPLALKGGRTRRFLQCGSFYKTSLSSGELSNIKTLTALSQVLYKIGFDPDISLAQEICPDDSSQGIRGILILDETNSLHFFIRFDSDRDELWKLSQIETQSSTANPRIPSQWSRLTTKRIGIVGLGSIGSKMATSLARTGVGYFYLVDDDIFLPENLARHELDWRNVGEHKTQAISERLSLISSHIKIETATLNIGGQESSACLDKVLKQLSECDLIVDATANPRVFNFLAVVATKAKKQFIWMEVFAGGIGGMIARHRPEQDPEPYVMRAMYHTFVESQGIPLEGFVRAEYIFENSDGEVAIASDAEVSIIASHATKLAIDTLLMNQPSQFPYSIYLIGLEKAWIFSAPFDTIPIDTSNPLSIGDEAQMSSQQEAENFAFIRELLEEINDADSST